MQQANTAGGKPIDKQKTCQKPSSFSRGKLFKNNNKQSKKCLFHGERKREKDHLLKVQFGKSRLSERANKKTKDIKTEDCITV